MNLIKSWKIVSTSYVLKMRNFLQPISQFIDEMIGIDQTFQITRNQLRFVNLE